MKTTLTTLCTLVALFVIGDLVYLTVAFDRLKEHVTRVSPSTYNLTVNDVVKRRQVLVEKSELSELEGALRRNIKWTSPYTLRIDGNGVSEWYLSGAVLHSIPDGTHVAVSCIPGGVAPRAAVYDPGQVWRITEKPLARALSGDPQDAAREAQALMSTSQELLFSAPDRASYASTDSFFALRKALIRAAVEKLQARGYAPVIEGQIVKGAQTATCVDVTAELVQIIKDLIAQGAVERSRTSRPTTARGRGGGHQ